MFERVEIIQGDIITLKVDAIVNAANASLKGGGGVDGAIHQSAGPALLRECRALGGCSTGEAKITKGYNLPAEWIIHTVGPIWNDGKSNENTFLARCYRNVLKLAKKHGIKTIAFPSISTGAYGYPIAEASRIALKEISDFLENDTFLKKIIIVCFAQHVFDEYKEAQKELLKSREE